MSQNVLSIDLSKYENYKKIPFSDLDQSFFPKNFKLNNFSLNSCYLFIEDENDVYNPKLNLKIQFHPPNECSNVSILIAKIKEKLNLNLWLGNGTKLFLKKGAKGNWNIRLKNQSSMKLGKVMLASGVEVICEIYGEVNIEDDCLFSNGITIQCGDQHGIISLEDKKIINSEKPRINIGKHFWCGRNASIVASSKEVNIGSGSILGLGSVLAKSMPKNCIFAGNPAKKIRDNVSWSGVRYPNKKLINEIIENLNKT